MDALESFVDQTVFFGNAGLGMKIDGKLLYIDPAGPGTDAPADIILITHDHGDHFDPDTLKRLSAAHTVVAAPKSVVSKLGSLKFAAVHEVSPGKSLQFGKIAVDAVPAYNVVKADKHPKENNWVGYVLAGDGMRVYITGDTERIPEMVKIKADIVFQPIGQTYTMNSVEEAARVPLDVGAKIAVPIHWGLYEGTQEDADAFVSALSGKVKVILKKRVG